MPEVPGTAAFRQLWRLVHEGGIEVKTNLTDDVDSPPALRTLIQLDGDRVVTVFIDSIRPLSHMQRLRLAVRHRRSVRAVSFDMLTRLTTLVRVAQGVVLCGLGGFEAYRVAAIGAFPASVAAIDWTGLLWDQSPAAAAIAAHRLMPYGLRLLHRVTARRLAGAHRKVSHDAFCKLRQWQAAGSPLPPG